MASVFFHCCCSCDIRAQWCGELCSVATQLAFDELLLVEINKRKESGKQSHLWIMVFSVVSVL